MAVSEAPWQLQFEKMEQRCSYLLKSGQWSDCNFMVGSETNQTAVSAHKFVLAMVSPVFEAMFYGGLSESNDPIVPIPDVQPEVFRALLQYIYTGHTDISSFDMALDLWYAANKYMLPHLVERCNSYICSVLGPTNVCRAYEFACLFDEKTLLDKCLKMISTDTKEVLNDSSFENVELNTLITVCSLDNLNVDNELDLFHAVARYAKAEQKRQGQFSPPEEEGPRSYERHEKLSQSVETLINPVTELGSKQPTEVVTSEPRIVKENINEVKAFVPEEPKPTIRGALQKIRFLSLSATQFAEGPALSELLTKDESFAVLMNILASSAGPVAMPTGFSECRQPRNNSTDQWVQAGSWEHIIKELNCGTPSRVEDALRAAVVILKEDSFIQEALDKGILDALGPALTKGNDTCKNLAASAIYKISYYGSLSQRRVLAEAAALQPLSRQLTSVGGTYDAVQWGLVNLLDLMRLEQGYRHAYLLKLRELCEHQTPTTVERDDEYVKSPACQKSSLTKSNMKMLKKGKKGIKSWNSHDILQPATFS